MVVWATKSKMSWNVSFIISFFQCIRYLWKLKQEDFVKELKERGRDLVVGGDGRHSTVGKSALYCTYSVQDCESRKIINVEQVYVSILDVYAILKVK